MSVHLILVSIVDYNPVSLIDFPGRLSTVVFTKGCNLRCRFCYNPELVLNRARLDIEDEFFEYIEKNKIEAAVITGGEPLMDTDIEGILIRLNDMGLAVKLDTNGSFPKMLYVYLQRNLVDFVSLDLKGLNTEDMQYITRVESFTLSKFLYTLNIIKAYKNNVANESINFNFEIRLTLWKPYEVTDFLKFLEELGENGIILDEDEYIIIQRLNIKDKLLDKTFRNNKLANLASSDNYIEKLKKGLENFKNIKIR